MADESTQPVAHEWVSFPGGELEGRRPGALCPACREASLQRLHSSGTLCFQCYRANLDRERALRQAATVDTASQARFQEQLPFEPINGGRLATLQQERATARGALLHGTARFADRRRRAQIAARHALQSIVAARPAGGAASAIFDRTIAAALHAAELQLPESWLPFVVAR